MAALAWRVCDLQGRTLASVRDRLASSVTVPVNDLRSGTLTLSVETPAAAAIRPLTTLLKASYQGTPVLTGVVQEARYPPASGTVEVNALGVEWRLACSYLDPPAPQGTAYVFTRTAVDQGLIIRDLVNVTAGKWAAVTGGPPFGILVQDSLIEVSRLRDRSYEPGQQVWDAIVNLTGVLGGPDVEFDPVDQTDGLLARLRVYARQGRDQTAVVRFADGWGPDNALIDWTSTAANVVNRSVLTGQSEDGATQPYYISGQPDSQQAAGPYERFTARPDVSLTATLTELAQAEASTYAFPVDAFTITPRLEGDGRSPRPFGVPPPADPSRLLPDGYWVGDVVQAVRQVSPDGGLRATLRGRVVKVTLADSDQAGNTQATVECSTEPELYAVT